MAIGQFALLRLPASASHSQVFNQEPGRDASRLKNDRKSTSRVGSPADQIDGLQILKAVTRAEMEHLRKVVGQIEGGAAVDFKTLVPVCWCNDVFETNPALDVFDPDLGQCASMSERNLSRWRDQSTLGCWCVTGTRT